MAKRYEPATKRAEWAGFKAFTSGKMKGEQLFTMATRVTNKIYLTRFEKESSSFLNGVKGILCVKNKA